MKWKNLHTPNTIELNEATASERYGQFTIEPLERGFGLTIGNSLRRVLLSNLQGAAVTAAKIEGVLHEFSTIPGVIEDVSEIILNLKQMRFKLHADYKINARLKKNGPGELKAADLQADPGVEVLNPDLHIATLNKDAEIDMEVEISGGRGYVPADQQEEERPIGVVPVDAHFSPIKKVNFEVENTRVGQRVDFDKLTLELWSDGSILPKDAMAYAAMILKDHFSMFVDFEEPIEREVEEEEDKEVARIHDLMEKSVEELELSVRSANCLRAAGIKSIGELVQKSESAMLKYRNFGRKSLKEISDILGEMGLHFGMEVTPYMWKSPKPASELEAPLAEEQADPGMDIDDVGAFGDVKNVDDAGEAEELQEPEEAEEIDDDGEIESHDNIEDTQIMEDDLESEPSEDSEVTPATTKSEE
jgi:DNA-directed RNA polymerase subunit alpha